MNNVENNKEISTTITGITEEVTTLKEIISIEIAGITYPGDMEQSSTLIATTYEGEKINFSNR